MKESSSTTAAHALDQIYLGWTSCTPIATESPTHPIMICYLLQLVVTPPVCCVLYPHFPAQKMYLKSFSEMLFFPFLLILVKLQRPPRGWIAKQKMASLVEVAHRRTLSMHLLSSPIPHIAYSYFHLWHHICHCSISVEIMAYIQMWLPLCS